MPTYEYLCRECGETFDVYYRSFAESERAEGSKNGGGVECARCGAKKSAERVFSVFGTRSGGSSSPSSGAAPMGGGGSSSCCGGGGCGCG
jgi:predicted nucleic acid-binding Zn ribbon protein